MSSSIFYIGFIFGAYPAIFLAQRYPIERVASLVIIVWGITLILTPACQDFRGLYAQRFFLGFTEAGISPMFMMIVVCSLYRQSALQLELTDAVIAAIGRMVQER
jgi:MFS family permease